MQDGPILNTIKFATFFFNIYKDACCGLAGERDLFSFSASGFDPFYTCMSSSRCFICPLSLHGVQWIRGLVVVHVSWPGYPGLKKKNYYF
jgi:hypothetical protein